YTRQGGISVSWGESVADDPERWYFQVEDTGPVFHAGPGSPLAGALEVATEQAQQITDDAQTGQVTHVDGEAAEAPRTPRDRRRVQQLAGEGIGLSIVKRLCELLDATVEFESTIGVGTRVRILLPRQYAE